MTTDAAPLPAATYHGQTLRLGDLVRTTRGTLLKGRIIGRNDDRGTFDLDVQGSTWTIRQGVVRLAGFWTRHPSRTRYDVMRAWGRDGDGAPLR